MITVQKFPLPLGDDGTIEAPASVQPLHIGLDPNETACLWASVDGDEPKTRVAVHSIGTGWPIPPSTRYIGSVTAAGRVWHYFLALP